MEAGKGIEESVSGNQDRKERRCRSFVVTRIQLQRGIELIRLNVEKNRYEISIQYMGA